MIPTLKENQYLDVLVESKYISNRRQFVMDIDFTNNELYTGKETIGEMLFIEGVVEEYLSEGALSMPISKIKSMAAEIGKNMTSMEGLGKISSKFGPMAKKVPPKNIEVQAKHLAALKGIPEKNLNGWWEQTVRMAASLGIIMTSAQTGLLWVLIFVLVMQSDSLEDMSTNFKNFFAEWKKAIDRNDSEYEKSFAFLGLAWKLIIICFIPPFIQSVVLMPLASIYILAGYILLVMDVYAHFGKKS